MTLIFLEGPSKVIIITIRYHKMKSDRQLELKICVNVGSTNFVFSNINIRIATIYIYLKQMSCSCVNISACWRQLLSTLCRWIQSNPISPLHNIYMDYKCSRKYAGILDCITSPIF